MLCRLSKMTGDFGRCESGAGTVLGLFTFMSVATIGAIALDVSYLRATKDQLQIAADQAAHAALYRRSTQKHEQARADAVDLTDQILGGASFKGALTTTDIEFGTFLSETRTFTADPNSKTAVRVVTSLERDRNNAANTFLFRMIGIEDFELRAETIFATYRPGCLREGFIAEGVVDMQSNNSVLSGFCIHSNSYVSLNQNNYFQPGTIVGMPNVEDLDLPKSGFERNDGLAEALRNQKINIRVLDHVSSIDTRLRNGDIDTVPGYITSPSMQSLSTTTLSMADLVPGSMYDVFCSGKQLTIDGSTPLKNVVIVTDCPVKLSKGAALEDVLLVTKSTDSNSITSPNGFRLGADDSCAAGGGAQIVTSGGINVASDLQIFGSQLIAQGDVTFAASADSVEGASIISAGKIDGTSNSQVGFCNTGMEDNIEIDYFRMVR